MIKSNHHGVDAIGSISIISIKKKKWLNYEWQRTNFGMGVGLSHNFFPIKKKKFLGFYLFRGAQILYGV